MKKLFVIIGLAIVMLNAKAQTITSFSPASGLAGTLVTFIGADLSNPTAVSIGGQSAIVISSSATQVVAMVMPGATTGALSVSTSAGTANATGNFTVVSSKVPDAQQGNKLVGNDAVGTVVSQGQSVALSADGNTAIVGGLADNTNKGAAWIYVRTGGTWVQQGAKLVGDGAVGAAQQGSSVALSADGNTAIVGGYADDSNKGAAWIWVRTGTTWAQQGTKLVGNDVVGAARQGYSVALSADGNTAMVGGFVDGFGKGAVWAYVRTAGTWTQQGPKLVGTGAVGSAFQGGSIALSADGTTAIVDGSNDDSNKGAAWIYVRTGTTWAQQGPKLVGTGAVGNAYQGTVAISADGNTAMVGGYADDGNKGAAWVYVRTGTTWAQQGSKLVGLGAVGNAKQGHSVALSADGNTAMVSGYVDDTNKGAVWVYVRTGTTWTQQGAKLVGAGAAVDAHQGSSVALSADGTTAMVGGRQDASGIGAAWVYAAPPPTIQYTPSTINAVKKITNINQLPILGNNVGETFNITPALPTGLSFNTTTGLISGTPTANSATTNYTITITNSNGLSATTVVSITVAEPPIITTLKSNYVFVVNKAITAIEIVNTGGTIPAQLASNVNMVGYFITPALPSGLTLNVNTGKIEGTPTVLQNTTSYTITATNEVGGSNERVISIEVTNENTDGAGIILKPSNNTTKEHPNWLIENIANFPTNEVTIYDRYGRKLKRILNYNNESNYWDGTIDGKRIEQGTYYFVIDLGEGKDKVKGFISVFN
ncbi:MAG: putative Ig domain-containing protein [Sphingobacteriaceae bacterium]|nr:putative Ig domain-containing protein [Sphingobacteriaceae bacterium]